MLFSFQEPDSNLDEPAKYHGVSQHLRFIIFMLELINMEVN